MCQLFFRFWPSFVCFIFFEYFSFFFSYHPICLFNNLINLWSIFHYFFYFSFLFAIISNQLHFSVLLYFNFLFFLPWELLSTYVQPCFCVNYFHYFAPSLSSLGSGFEWLHKNLLCFAFYFAVFKRKISYDGYWTERLFLLSEK